MIFAYVGLPGTGKTLSMVHDAEPLIRRGVRVITNFPFRWKKLPDGSYKYSSLHLNPVDFIDAIEYEDNATFLVDECNILFSSYDDAKKIDRGLLNRFAQGRKLNLDFYFTSQRFHHSLKRIRDLTNVVIECKKYSFLGINVFRNVYYNPVIYDREALFDTPLEAKYILKKKFIFPWDLPLLYNKYPTEYLIQSKNEFLRKNESVKEYKPMEI